MDVVFNVKSSQKHLAALDWFACPLNPLANTLQFK